MRFLFGKYRYSIDSKGRVSVPQRFREVLKNGDDRTLVLLEGFEGCLFCYPPDVFEQILHLLSQEAKDFDNEDVRELLRWMAAHGSEVEMDGQGRIQLTDDQRAVGKLEREALLVGVGNRIEIWSPEEFNRRPNKSNGAGLAEGVLRKLDVTLKRGDES